MPSNALVIAKIEKEAGIRASYYFRIVKESYDENIIRQIAEMGHEIGYHYENLSDPQISQIDADLRFSHRPTQTDTDICPADFAGQKESSLREKTEIRGQMSEVGGRRSISHRHTQTHTDIYPADFAGQKMSSLREKKEVRDELFELAIDDFRLNLEKLRKFYPVKTICMHGSPLSKWDNRDLWKRYNYRDYGIIAEPYFDLDFDEVFYLTDTGRSWNNSKANIRDNVRTLERGNVGTWKGGKVRMLERWNVGTLKR